MYVFDIKYVSGYVKETIITSYIDIVGQMSKIRMQRQNLIPIKYIFFVFIRLDQNTKSATSIINDKNKV